MKKANRHRPRKQNQKAKRKNKVARSESHSTGQKTLTTQQSLELAVQHHSAGRLPEAESIYQQILQTDPNHLDALHLLGVIAHQVGKNDIAANLITKAIAIKPDFAEAHSNLGNVLRELGKLDDAHASCDKAIAIKPDYAEAHSNLGSVLKELGKLDEALTSCHTALAIKPDFPDAHCNLGAVLKELGRLDEAVVSYQNALAINPNSAEAYNNLGTVLQELGKLEEAAAILHKALAINPDSAEVHFNFGMLQLLTGDFQDGWKNFAWRWQAKGFAHHQRNYVYKEPFWDWEKPKEGSAIVASSSSKILLVWMEQGVGDEIMFASMLPDLKRVAGAIVVECDKRLLPIFERSFPEISFIAHRDLSESGLIDGGYDFQLPAGDLGGHFRPDRGSFPKQQAFLHPDAEKQSLIRADYSQRWPGKCLVGVSWRSGNAAVGAKRSLLLDQWRPILTNADCRFISLQYGDVEKDLAALKKNTGVDIFFDTSIDPLRDMDAFAAQIAALDLVISIDNSTVHVAGALGIATWTMLPFSPDWRWLLECDNSAWYPSMRLFRQQEHGDWKGVIESVREALLNHVGDARD